MGIYGIVLNESRSIDNTIGDDLEKLDDKIIITPKTALVLTVPNSLTEPVIFTALSTARSGIPSDGKITVSSIEKVVDVEEEELDQSLSQWYQLTK